MRLLTASFLVLMCCGSAIAATPPPALPFSSISWKATAAEKAATGLRLGTYAIAFEETTLAGVRAAVESGELQHQGDAGESIYWLCYTIAGKERIWITAHGEMGGPEHAVTSVSGQEIKGVKINKDCPALPTRLQPVSLDKGLWLGTTEKEALKVLGPVSYSEGSWRSVDYQGKVPGNCDPGGFDLTNWVLYKSEKDRLTTLIAGQVTSC